MASGRAPEGLQAAWRIINSLFRWHSTNRRVPKIKYIPLLPPHPLPRKQLYLAHSTCPPTTPPPLPPAGETCLILIDDTIFYLYARIASYYMYRSHMHTDIVHVYRVNFQPWSPPTLAVNVLKFAFNFFNISVTIKPMFFYNFFFMPSQGRVLWVYFVFSDNNTIFFTQFS